MARELSCSPGSRAMAASAQKRRRSLESQTEDVAMCRGARAGAKGGPGSERVTARDGSDAAVG